MYASYGFPDRLGLCSGMRFLLFFVLFFSALPAAAQADPECTLQNKDLCGKWNGNDNSMIVVMGNRLEQDDGNHENCIILQEERHENRAYSLLKCRRKFIYTEKTESGDFQFVEREGGYFPLLILRPKKYQSEKDEKYMRLFFIEWMRCVVPGSPYQLAEKEICSLQDLENQNYSSFVYYGDSP